MLPSHLTPDSAELSDWARPPTCDGPCPSSCHRIGPPLILGSGRRQGPGGHGAGRVVLRRQRMSRERLHAAPATPSASSTTKTGGCEAWGMERRWVARQGEGTTA